MIFLFTGLVEEIGTIQSIRKGTKSATLIIKAQKVLEQVHIGDSICTNGVCLTVTDFTKHSFSVDVMAETIRRSNLKNLIPGSNVNLERALQFNDRLGGHLVSGHIDGVGIIESFQKEDNAVWVAIEAPPEILKYVVPKGSIAIDGISLTVAFVDPRLFKVSVIPHTKNVTTLLNKDIGDEVNLEGDMIGKYVERFLSYRTSSIPQKKGGTISTDFLTKHGFI